jgi:hypothetical protein
MRRLVPLILIVVSAVMLSSCTKSIMTDTKTENSSSAQILNSAETGIQPGNKIKENGDNVYTDNSGIFSFKMSGYKGEISIEVHDGKYYGTIKFSNWGNGTPQPLNDLKVTENKIYFKRIIRTKDDLIKYGGTAYFEQDFYGIFTEDRKKIKGYYMYAGTQDSWEAVKN